MTRKFIHAVVPSNATVAHANRVTDLLEGRGLTFGPNSSVEVPEFVATEYILYSGDRLEPVLPSEMDDLTRERVVQMFVKLNSAKIVGVLVSSPMIGCRVVHDRSTAN